MSFAVVKVGGGLTKVPGALDQVCSVLAEVSRSHALVIVPGGGPFADAVREFGRGTELSTDAAHWMAILAMDQYAQVLVERIPGAVLVEESDSIGKVLTEGHVAVLAPARWMRAADALPHSWDVTSDSIAAFITGALGAERLVLIKPTGHGSRLDSYFQRALPAGMPYAIFSCDGLEELPACLSGQTAAGVPLA
jgi:aspartokinase-like uncharacterized kinase